MCILYLYMRKYTKDSEPFVGFFFPFNTLRGLILHYVLQKALSKQRDACCYIQPLLHPPRNALPLRLISQTMRIFSMFNIKWALGRTWELEANKIMNYNMGWPLGHTGKSFQEEHVGLPAQYFPFTSIIFSHCLIVSIAFLLISFSLMSLSPNY